MNHRVEIVYCTKCRWLLRAAWMAQELLTTFDGEIAELVLKPGTAEVAFAVVDDYHGQGIGTVLMRHLAELARRGGLQTLVADVLPENRAMLRVLEKSGLPLATTHDQGVAHVALQL